MLARYTFLLNTRISRIASAATTLPRGSPWGWMVLRAFAAVPRCAWYQAPIFHRITIPASATRENHATLRWPRGTTMKAARSGPIADPVLPPTWNSDWAKPWRPPEAILATRDDSGWKTAEPIP